MDKSQKRASARPRRPQTLPPPEVVETDLSLGELWGSKEPIQRFRGKLAPLASLAAQLRAADARGDQSATAEFAGRLVRQLAKRRVELREVLGLSQKVLSLHPDAELAEELAGHWAQVGAFGRAARLLGATIDALPESVRATHWRRVGQWAARAGDGEAAWAAFEQCAEGDAEILEEQGALGFWLDKSPAEVASIYLKAAELRERAGEEALALDDALRAFEVAPLSWSAAEGLSKALERRGRKGAAEEILRTHFRLGPAAPRVAHYQRQFLSALERREWAKALAAAIEAELDVELDPDRVFAVLSRSEAQPSDFESLLVELALRGPIEQQGVFGLWLVSLIELHVFDWGRSRAVELRELAVEKLGIRLFDDALESLDEPELKQLRWDLGREADEAQQMILRERIARQELLRGAFADALDRLEPLLVQETSSLVSAALGVLVSGRTREPVARARALARLARNLPGVFAASLGAVAAESLIAEGLLAEAKKTAELASLADPASERALASRAWVALRSHEATSSGQIEASLSVLVARAETSLALARAAEKRGALSFAVTWAERAFALRPGDLLVARYFLRLLEQVTESERIVRGVRAVLRSPLPAEKLSACFASALRTLTATDAVAALGLAKRLLEGGVAQGPVRQAMEELARQSAAAELSVQLLERDLVGAEPAQRSLILLELGRARLTLGDEVSASRAFKRALSLGASPEEIERLSARLPEELEPDGRLAWLELRIELSERLHPESVELRVELLWTLGVLRWDAAEDHEGALRAWLAAVELQSERGLPRLAVYVCSVAGVEEGARLLERLANETESLERSAQLLGYAARALLGAELSAAAFRLGQKAVERDPSRLELLPVIERAAGEGDNEQLALVYEQLARATLGCYGERAVRYRAARQLERRGAVEAALAQAIGAFEAVPAEGVSFVLMARLSDHLEKTEPVVRTLEKVAAAAATPAEKERWLDRAAALADTSSIGRRQKVDILLRAAMIRPEEATLRALSEAMGKFLEFDPTARGELKGRFRAVVEDALAVVSGAYGAMLAILLAEAALQHFDDVRFAWSCLKRAVAWELDLDEYAQLKWELGRLAGHPELAWEVLEQVRRRYEQEGAPLGQALAELSASCAELLGDDSLAAEFLTRAALDTPGRAEFIGRARASAERANRLDLLQLLEELLPVSERARSVLARVDSMNHEEALDVLLEIDLEATPEELRIKILRVLADKQERMGRVADARDSFSELLELVPQDESALRGLERVAERDQDHEELARILRLRAEAAPDSEDARRISLRRAVVLETQLGRASEARVVLEELLQRSGDSWAVLRVLADSWERSGDFAKAASLWHRARQVAPDVESVADVSFRAARAYFEAGDAKRAREALSLVESDFSPALELRLAVERTLEDPRAILEALSALAEQGREEAPKLAEWLLEAAEIGVTLGEFGRVEEFVQGALALGQDSPSARLLACQMRVRREGISSAQEALRVQNELRGTQALKSPAQRELRSYLLAETRGVLEGHEAARQELEQALSEQGPRPLLSVALAERLDDAPERALSLYERSIGGDFLHMKRPGDLWLAACAVARAVEQWDRAQALASAVRDDDPRRPDAARELEAIALSRARAERLERESAQLREAELRADPERAREEAEKRRAQARLEIARLAREAEAEARASVGRTRQEEQVSWPAPQPKVTLSLGETLPSPQPPELPRSVPSVPPELPLVGSLAAARKQKRSEADLVRALDAGDLASGEELLERLRGDRARSQDAITVAAHLVQAAPSNEVFLRGLVDVASRDGNEPWAQAVQHVLGAFGAAAPVVAPELEKLEEQPDATRAILWRGVQTNSAESFALVWEHAQGWFKREIANYGLSGLERVQPHAQGALHVLYRQAARVLGSRAALYRGEPSEEISLRVILSSPPSVLVSGQVEEMSPELAFHLGAMLVAANPEHALLFGLDPAALQDLLHGLALSFGPSDNRPGEVSAEATRLAGYLWETIPARVQRRLSQLCAESDALSLPNITEASRIVLRRSGLLVCGDIVTAVADACQGLGVSTPSSFSELESLSEQSPIVQDLLRFSTSLEYAELRFRC